MLFNTSHGNNKEHYLSLLENDTRKVFVISVTARSCYNILHTFIRLRYTSDTILCDAILRYAVGRRSRLRAWSVANSQRPVGGAGCAGAGRRPQAPSPAARGKTNKKDKTSKKRGTERVV